jgi:O-acetyl-ADP-ribose deacetylase (regulator of RNase III)
MGGGATSSLVARCGETVLEAVRVELAKTSRLVRTAVITASLNLGKRGVKYILHIVSIIRDTPQGAYCPTPKLLPHGVETALKLSFSKGCRSLAQAASATGEGRVGPADAARFMLTGVSQFQAKYKADLDITLCLPTASDHEAFQAMPNKKTKWGRT